MCSCNTFITVAPSEGLNKISRVLRVIKRLGPTYLTRSHVTTFSYPFLFAALMKSASIIWFHPPTQRAVDQTLLTVTTSQCHSWLTDEPGRRCLLPTANYSHYNTRETAPLVVVVCLCAGTTQHVHFRTRSCFPLKLAEALINWYFNK